jgi:hypothetical protein
MDSSSESMSSPYHFERAPATSRRARRRGMRDGNGAGRSSSLCGVAVAIRGAIEA